MIIYKYKEGVLSVHLDNGTEVESAMEGSDYWFGHNNRHFHYLNGVVGVYKADKTGENTWETGEFIERINVIEI